MKPGAVSAAALVATLSFTPLNSSPSCSPSLFRSRVHLILGLTSPKTTVMPKKEPSACLNPYSQQHSHLFLLIGCSLTLYFQELTPAPTFQKDQGASRRRLQTDSHRAGKAALLPGIPTGRRKPPPTSTCKTKSLWVDAGGVYNDAPRLQAASEQEQLFDKGLHL